MTQTIEYFNSYSVGDFFTSAIVYGDYTGLTSQEEQQLNEFMIRMPNCPTFSFDPDEQADYSFDEITGLFGQCLTLEVWAPKPDIVVHEQRQLIGLGVMLERSQDYKRKLRQTLRLESHYYHEIKRTSMPNYFNVKSVALTLSPNLSYFKGN